MCPPPGTRASIICLLNPARRAAAQLLPLALSPIHELVERLTREGRIMWR